MKLALALVFGDEINDQVNYLAWQSHVLFDVNLDARRLPPHVSLKQPFEVGESIQLMNEGIEHLKVFAAKLVCHPVEFGQATTWPGVLHYPVRNHAWLGQAHAELNSQLGWAPNQGSADFDGDDYSFHLTVCMDSNEPAKIEKCSELARGVDLPTAMPVGIAVFAYRQKSKETPWNYIQVKTFPLRS